MTMAMMIDQYGRQARLGFILATTLYNLGHVVYLWILLVQSAPHFISRVMMIAVIINVNNVYEPHMSLSFQNPWSWTSFSPGPHESTVLAYSSTHILAFIVTNLFFYSGIRCTHTTILMTAKFSVFYLTMKLLWGERPTNWVNILLKSIRPW